MRRDDFTRLIEEMGREHWRSMPWRDDTNPYFVVVSELMLQQTQVSRVLPKFDAFIARFPDVAKLATASLAEVIELWQGLGYNRRAKYLHEMARTVEGEYGGQFPRQYSELLQLPGIGPNTAGAIMAYAYNTPVTFIETNIRTVYIHHFFADDFAVDDAQLRDLLEETLDQEHPREFYWALMDYGSWLKANGVRNNSQSRQYKKQAPLAGSVREVRGQILRQLTVAASSEWDLRIVLGADERFDRALHGLADDGLIQLVDGYWRLTR